MRPNDDGAQLFTRDLILAAIELGIIENNYLKICIRALITTNTI